VRKVIAPGETYAELVEEFGPPEYERDLVAATLTGAHRGVLIVMLTDDWVITSKPQGYGWGNCVSIHAMQAPVEGTPAKEWVVRACAAFCGAMEIAHGFACVGKEYDARTRGGGRRWRRGLTLCTSPNFQRRDRGGRRPQRTVEVDLVKNKIRLKEGRKVRKRSPLIGQD
jgi:hypothetical protein